MSTIGKRAEGGQEGVVQRLLSRAQRREGVCVWLTGLSGSGKSTTAAVLRERTRDPEHLVVLDGDDVRAAAPCPLGFSKDDRDRHVLQVAARARELVDAGAIVICALISPYRDSRARARHVIGANRFIEVFVDTPLTVCEQRDVKGLYARARRGEIASFTGIDDPYEPPMSPDLVITTTAVSAERNAARILRLLHRRSVRGPAR